MRTGCRRGCVQIRAGSRDVQSGASIARKIIGESHDEAIRLLSAHRKQLDALVGALLGRETLNEQEILEVTGLPRAPALETGILPAGDGNSGDGHSRDDSASPRAHKG